MAVDFPNSPTVGQIYSAGGVTRRWDGTTWSIVPVTIQGVTGSTGLQGIQGPSGITTATAPLTYDSGTKTVALSYGTSLTTSTNSLVVNSSIIPYLSTSNTFTGTLTATSFIKTSGLSTQFLKADGSVDSSTYLTTTSAASTYLPLTGGTITSDLVVSGNLTINGTTTTLNSTTITVDDKNIELGSVTTPTNTTADGGGITLKGTTDKTFNWINATGSWTSSEDIDLATGKVLRVAGTQILSPTQYVGNAATVTNGFYTTSSFNLGTTSIAINRASGAQSLTGISIDGNAGTVTNGVYTNISNTITGSLTAQSFIPSSATIPTNGLYLPTTNTISLATNTTERFRIDSNGSVKLFGQILESATVSATAANTTVTYDVITSKNVLYYTSSATANWTFNVRGNSTVTLNSLMDVGQSLTVVFLNTNAATAYYPTAFQIDGTAVTPKWQGGTAPSAGNANSIDSYSYTIIKTASTPTYTVLASQTKFA